MTRDEAEERARAVGHAPSGVWTTYGVDGALGEVSHCLWCRWAAYDHHPVLCLGGGVYPGYWRLPCEPLR